jgi:hypothetical protein
LSLAAEYIPSCCKASNRCSINDETIQLLDYQFSAVAERQGMHVSQTHGLRTSIMFDPHDCSDVMLALNDRQ